MEKTTPATEGRGVIECQIFIAATPEAIFPFLVKPQLMARWIGLCRSQDPANGGPFCLDFLNGYVASGVYTEISAPRRVAFTWGWEGRDEFPPGASLVEIELIPKDGGTLVVLRHSDLPENASHDISPPRHRQGWTRYLDRLEVAATERWTG